MWIRRVGEAGAFLFAVVSVDFENKVSVFLFIVTSNHLLDFSLSVVFAGLFGVKTL